MRRKFIIVLLGIIIISTISSLLSGYGPVESDKVLLDTVGGIVGAGNISYWQLAHSGALVVELSSISGDADLYVSDGTRPSYEPDKNNFSSVTCGSDVVSIPTEFPRPLGIGVFGHWSHTVSEYSIKVFMDTSALSDISYMEQYSSSETSQSKENSQYGKSDDENKPKFLKVISILDMIFETFVL